MLDSAAVQNYDIPARPGSPATPAIPSGTVSSARGESAPTNVGWILLILAALYVGYFSHLGALGFVGPDEPRYAWVAREMVESGDWVTPRLYGKPWFEKPVLYYWGAAAAFKLFGVSEASARLPSAISALLATLALAWLAWRTYGPKTPRFLFVMLPLTVAMIGFSHAAAPDMPFAAMLTLAMVCAAVILGVTNPRSSNSQSPISRVNRAPLVAFGFFLGVASLAKGPAAIILAGGATFLWALGTKRWRDAFRLTHPMSIAAFCATALPWYVLCARRNPDFLRIFIVEHNFARFLTPVFQHVRPFWFFAPVILLGVLPWTLVVVSIGRDVLRKYRAATLSRSLLWFSGCWALVPILFFSLSKSKLPGYILPSFPPLILLFARNIVGAESDRHRKEKWLVLAQAGMFVALGIAAKILQSRIAGGVDLLLPPWRIQFIYVAIAGGILMACLGLWRRRGSTVVMPGAVLMLVLVGIVQGGLGDIDSIYFSRDATKLASAVYPAIDPKSAFVYQVPRAQHYSLNFYLHRELPEWTPQQQNAGWIFTSFKQRAVMESLGLACSQRQKVVSTSLIVCVRP
ncbi:MAG TPA: glycosyltransferase family 39 protein [Candidatus Dormibacteraeota bacterium]|nr:glycosyltransferase family 39 protein [Candidatus Dormibacteraeota bacterium]